MISTTGDNYGRFSLYLMHTGLDARQDIIAGRVGDTLSQQLWVRMLFVAQLVISIVSVPLALLAMLLAPAFALCTEGSREAWTLMKNMGKLCLLHLSLIPTWFVSTFVPHSWDCISPFKETFECLDS